MIEVTIYPESTRAAVEASASTSSNTEDIVKPASASCPNLFTGGGQYAPASASGTIINGSSSSNATAGCPHPNSHQQGIKVHTDFSTPMTYHNKDSEISAQQNMNDNTDGDGLTVLGRPTGVTYHRAVDIITYGEHVFNINVKTAKPWNV